MREIIATYNGVEPGATLDGHDSEQGPEAKTF
jgi:hypothetical protein